MSKIVGSKDYHWEKENKEMWVKLKSEEEDS